MVQDPVRPILEKVDRVVHHVRDRVRVVGRDESEHAGVVVARVAADDPDATWDAGRFPVQIRVRVQIRQERRADDLLRQYWHPDPQPDDLRQIKHRRKRECADELQGVFDDLVHGTPVHGGVREGVIEIRERVIEVVIERRPPEQIAGNRRALIRGANGDEPS